MVWCSCCLIACLDSVLCLSALLETGKKRVFLPVELLYERERITNRLQVTHMITMSEIHKTGVFKVQIAEKTVYLTIGKVVHLTIPTMVWLASSRNSAYYMR